jgi:hypothetical protein
VTPQLQTNRDLYLAIDELSKQKKNCDRSLAIYLLALLNQSVAFANRESLTLAEFYEIIACSFTDAPAPFHDAWRIEYEKLLHKDEGFTGWRATIIRQIVELREMDECGTLKNENRYFGVSTPRTSYWVNFDPLGYLECAMAGSFGGWDPGDDTGRRYVPGQVAVFAEDGSIQHANPEVLPNPTLELSMVTWDHFKDFLICGQIYE